MTTAHQDDGTNTLLLGGLAALVVFGAGQWLAGNLATYLAHGHRLHAGLADAVVSLAHLPAHVHDPRRAWPPTAAQELPGAGLYWTATGLVVATLVVLTGLAMWRFGRDRHVSPDKRSRIGVETQPHLATRAELATLRTRVPVPGRFVIARQGRHLLSTEPATLGRHRRGVQGAVAIIGPSQSGKTTGLIHGTAVWAGAAIVSSVKTDLLTATIEKRRQVGEVKVFDPFGVTRERSATWSPLRLACRLDGAITAAETLVRASGNESPADRFWHGQAEQLLAGMLWVAANTDGQTMDDVVRWVLELDRPSDTDSGTLSPLARLLVDHPDPSIASDAAKVRGWFHGQWETDPRTTSSVYATARSAVWPWADPAAAATAKGCELTLDWLTSGNNTLYLCAPLGDEHRAGAIYTALLHDLTTQAFQRYNRSGRPFDPRLLLLIDEAANTPLPKLPQWAATITGAGIQLVTVWQSKAQIDQTYRAEADTILTNHRTKLVYPAGLADNTTAAYLSSIIGDEHIRADLDDKSAFGVEATGPRTDRIPGTSSPFLPAHVLRQARTGDAILIHGNLPPAWIKSAALR